MEKHEITCTIEQLELVERFITALDTLDSYKHDLDSVANNVTLADNSYGVIVYSREISEMSKSDQEREAKGEPIKGTLTVSKNSALKNDMGDRIMINIWNKGEQAKPVSKKRGFKV